MHMASMGLSVVVGNWVVTLLVRYAGYGQRTAGVVGSLTLLLALVSRPLAAALARARPDATRTTDRREPPARRAGTAVLATAPPLALAVPAAAAVGVASGIPFGQVMRAVAAARPEAPATAVGLTNMLANLLALVATPLDRPHVLAPRGRSPRLRDHRRSLGARAPRPATAAPARGARAAG